MQAGDQLGPYRVEASLGAGGMGEVYRATDTRLHRTVAIKILPHSKLADEDRKRRFLQEARAASALNHPNIVVLHDISSDGGVDFMVLEHVRGKTLKDRIREGALPMAEISRYGSQIASALAAAHAAGIVHRDIKPANIMITPENQVKVLDFGLAKLLETNVNAEHDTETIASITEPGMVLGTVSYMSPEQTRGEALDGRSDVFSLGTVLYEAATGRLPFQGPSMLAIMHAIAAAEPKPATQVSSGLPAELDHVLQRALAKEKSSRYSAAELADALQALSSGATTQIGSPARGKQRWAAAGILALLVIAGAIAAVYRWNSGASIDSIAVLPFANSDASLDTLSDGFTEDLINTLTQVADLKVLAPATVFHYKGRQLDPQSIGRDLGVRAVVMGRVTRSGDQATIRADLVNVKDGSELWGQQYTRPVGQVQAITQDVAQSIADRAHPSGKQAPRLARHHVADPQAYELYLQGRRDIREFTEHGFRQAIVDFQNAVDRDPDFAAAYAGLADAYSYQAGFELEPALKVMPLAEKNATKALEKDPETSEAYTSLGIVALTYDWELPVAEQRFRKALSLNPGDAFTQHFLGHYYEATGQWPLALAQMRKALSMDPLSPMFGEDTGIDLYMTRRYQEAADQVRKTVQLEPDDPMAHAMLSEALERTGSTKESLEEASKAAQLPGMPVVSGYIAGVFCRQGKREMARALLKQLAAIQEKGQYVDPLEFAMISFALGDKAKGFERLREAVEGHSFNVILNLSDRVFDTVRRDPQFVALMSKTGVPQATLDGPAR